MTVDLGLQGEKGKGRCILVGVQIDGDHRELLDWALGKFAMKGDRVVAVHVSRNSGSSHTSTFCLIKIPDEYLAVYEDLCRVKQVALVGRVARGSSIRKVLVREAGLCEAAAVVVGVSKNFSFGGSASLAKYCAKKLPPTTALIALHNGKVVFERGATVLRPGGEPRTNLRSLLYSTMSMDSKLMIRSGETMSDTVSLRLSDGSSRDSLKREDPNNGCLSVHARNGSYIPVLVRKLPESPGWPLLRRTASLEALKDTEARKMSVVQWVMTLPDRSSPRIQSASLELAEELERILKENPSSCCRWFSHEELQISTSQFSSENLIGNGGSSLVYKGCLPGGQQVAIKLPNQSEEASRDFLLEVDIITKLQHEHIVPLTGICINGNNLISVYSYFSRGNLEENLHAGKRSKPSLSWEKRFKVATGIAEALSYLHNDCSRPIIHRDVKSSNILLSDEFGPKLSDFNLALWAPTSTSHQTHSDVLGTFGYLAPEYFMYGRVSDKIDVYAFGVVLLELLSGRKPITDENPKGQESLVMWAAPMLDRGEFMELLDPNLEGKHDEDQMRRVALAACLCITRAARLRPPMSQVLSLLRGEAAAEKWMNLHRKSSLGDEDDEAYPASSVRSHLGLAFLDVDDDASVSSFEQSHLSSMEEYLQGRWSRSSSFD